MFIETSNRAHRGVLYYVQNSAELGPRGKNDAVCHNGDAKHTVFPEFYMHFNKVLIIHGNKAHINISVQVLKNLSVCQPALIRHIPHVPEPFWWPQAGQNTCSC